MRSPEFFIAKREERKELAEFLPSDLALVYGAGQKPHKWVFGGEMIGRRHSEDAQDRIFFKALKSFNEGKLGEEEKDVFRAEQIGEKKEIARLLSYDQQLSAGLSQYAREGRWGDYTSLLKSMAEMGKEIPSSADQQLADGLSQCAREGWWGVYASLFKTMAEMGKEIPSSADQQLADGLSQYAREGRWGAYASILKSMAEMGKATDQQLADGLSQYAREGRWGDYASLLKSMAEMGKEIPSSADQQLADGLSQCAREGWWDAYTSLFKTMAETGKEIPSSADQQLAGALSQCAREGRWGYYASIFKTMAEMGKEIPSSVDQQLADGLSQCAREGWWDAYTSLLKSMAEMGNIDFANSQYNAIREHIDTLPEDDRFFATSFIISTLAQGGALSSFHKKDGSYRVFQSLREAGIAVNDQMEEETKKVRDPEAWWRDHGAFFGRLLSLDISLAAGLIKEGIADGVPALNGRIAIYDKVLQNESAVFAVREALAKHQATTPHQLGTLLEIAGAFASAGRIDGLWSIIAEENPEPLLPRASRALLAVTAKGLGIEEREIRETDLSLWNTEYLPNLVSNDEMMRLRAEAGDEGMGNARELYRAIMRATFAGRFNDFLFNTGQDDDVGRDVARHNNEVRRLFEKNGIDYEQWLRYGKTKDFLVSTEVLVDKTEARRELLKTRADAVLREIAPLQEMLTEREYQPLLHLLAGTDSKKEITGVQGNELRQKLENLEERARTLKQKYPDHPSWSGVYEHMGHLREAVELVNQTDKKETESRERGFRIQLWRRDPKTDMFEGNYTQCCIAVGVKDIPPEGGLNTHDPATVMQFLADTGINVVEIYDGERKNPVGNTWLFVSKNNLGEPILIADNVEIHSDYTGDPHIISQIRENLFDFLGDYAKKCNLAGAGLGLVGTNDIPYRDINTAQVPPVDSIGGYLSEYTSQNTRAGRYYLEAYNHTTVGAIRPEVFTGNKPRERQSSAERERKAGVIVILPQGSGEPRAAPFTRNILSEIQNGTSALFSPENIGDIERIEGESFRGAARQPTEEILRTLSNTRGVQMLFKDGNRLKGYLSSLPASEAIIPVRNDAFDESDTTLYIESIAGAVDPFQTIRALKENAKKAGYEKLAVHGVNERLNRVLVRAGFELKEVVHNWLGTTAAYMEMEI